VSVWRGQGRVACLLSSFLFFRIRYVRYLMTFLWMFFHEGFGVGFWDVKFIELLYCMLTYGISDSNHDGYERVHFPSIVS